MKLSQFKTSEAREVEGVWHDVGDGLRLKVARMGNTQFNQVFNGLMKPHRRSSRMGNLSEDVAERVLARSMSEAILLDWEGLQDDDGTDIPYSKEKAYEFLLIKDFRLTVSELSEERSFYIEEENEEAAKNSAAS